MLRASSAIAGARCRTPVPRPTSAAGQPRARPRVGLVLAGGGAKGGAHVGVLKVLEEMHVPIDCIAGTSMGALVGGGYASGIPAAGLEEFVTGIDWKSVVGGVGHRELQTIEQKRAGVTYSNEPRNGPEATSGSCCPVGIVNTCDIEDLLRTYVAALARQTDFDMLPIPYRAVATDMITGSMVVLDSGDLATAMRASMAIPGAFAPVVIGPARPVRRRHGAQHPGGRRPRPLRGRGHRRQSGRAGGRAREAADGDPAAPAQQRRELMANENLQLEA